MRTPTPAIEAHSPLATGHDGSAPGATAGGCGDLASLALLSDLARLSSRSLIEFSSKHIEDLERGGSTFGLGGRVLTERLACVTCALVLLAARAEGDGHGFGLRDRLFDRARPYVDDWVDAFLQLTLRRDRRRLCPTTCD